MTLKAGYIKHRLKFLRPAGTSKGYLNYKDCWFISLWNDDCPQVKGIGECSILPNLSVDDRADVEAKIAEVCDQINGGTFQQGSLLPNWPSIQFALEMAMLDLQNGGNRVLFPSKFTQGKAGVVTNGLIWLGDESNTRQQIADRLDRGYSCIKLKIGQLDWPTEYAILRFLRKQFKAHELSIRVDANGAFSPQKAYSVLEQLCELEVHSIEQPIKAGQVEALALMCNGTPIPIALDEELLGIFDYKKRKELLETIKPQYLVVKPGLHGGFASSAQWVELARQNNIGWWATTALESNIGVNAIAQWAYTQNPDFIHGIGTGLLYSNNIDSPLSLRGESLFYRPNEEWNLSEIEC